jgi:hypothetical protein
MSYLLFCAIIGRKTAFEIDIQETRTVSGLKDQIKAEAETPGPARHLTLYQVDIDISTDEACEQALQQIFQSTTCAQVVQALPPNTAEPKQKELTNPAFELSKYFGNSDFSKEAIHILVKLPQGEPIHPRCGADSSPNSCTPPTTFIVNLCIALCL